MIVQSQRHFRHTTNDACIYSSDSVDVYTSFAICFFRVKYYKPLTSHDKWLALKSRQRILTSDNGTAFNPSVN